MQPLQSRVVTLCQQTLALGVVLAVLTPASGVVSLDIVGGSEATPYAIETVSNQGDPAQAMAATVPSESVEAEVTEVPLTTASGPAGAAGAIQGRTAAGRVVSQPQSVTGFAAVGVTWGHGIELEHDEIELKVRTRTGDAWSTWQEMEYHDEHGPDPESAEAATSRPGTEPLFVGEVDDVQVEARTTDGTLPADMSLSVIEPGEEEATSTETPDFAPTEGATVSSRAATEADPQRYVTQPSIFTRAQWGADERIRDRSSLRYGTINAGFVHHTVNANNYTEAQVPGILRSIYSYHVKSRGWSDIGYNFLVDRFGRIWEGRFGGIDKPVIGAHTLNYNQYSFAMSAIGNFDVVQPPDVMLRAYGNLFAWKLAMHGVNPLSRSQRLGSRTFHAINGHRDAGSTACPGRYLYAKLGTIRTYASRAGTTPPSPSPSPSPSPTPSPSPSPAPPVTVADPNPQSNLMGSPHPDLVVRRKADKRAVIIPTGGLTSFRTRHVAAEGSWRDRRDVVVSPDLTGDGTPDYVVVDDQGRGRVRPGLWGGKFGNSVYRFPWYKGSLLTAVGDINRDGRNDLVGRVNGRLVTFLGNGQGRLNRVSLGGGFGRYVQLVGPGDITGDGIPDLLARTKFRLYVFPGKGDGTFGRRTMVKGPWKNYNRLVAGGDYTFDGRPDLLGRRADGSVFLFPLRGNATYGSPIGPVTKVKRFRFLTSGGNLVGGPGADLVGVSGDKLVVIQNRGTYEFGKPVEAGVSFAGMNLLLNAGDVNRDGHGDVVTRDGRGRLWLYAGNGQGQLAKRRQIGRNLRPVVGFTAVGDVNGDGFPDLMGMRNNRLMLWAGNGQAFRSAVPVAGRMRVRAGLPSDRSRFDWVIPIQDMQLGRGNDFLVRERRTGRVLYYNGRDSGVSAPRLMAEGMEVYNLGG